MNYTLPRIAVASASFLYPMSPAHVWPQSPAAQRQTLGLPPPPASASPGIDGVPSAMTTPGLNQTGPTYSVYYVAPNGSDSTTPCFSIASACATVQHALNFATQPGDTVSIIPGTIYGGGSGTIAPVVFSHSGSGPIPGPGGACSSPITLETYPFSHDRAIIAGTRGATGAGAVTNVTYGMPPFPVFCIVINRIEFAGWNGDLPWGYVGENASHIPYSGSTTYDDYGMEFYGTLAPTQAHHIVIANSYVHDFPGGGIGTQRADYISVLSNIVSNSSQDSPYDGSCISLYQNQDLVSSGGAATHNIVEGNFASGCINLVPNDISGTVLAHLTSAAGTLSGLLTLDVAGPSMYLQSIVDGTKGTDEPLG